MSFKSPAPCLGCVNQKFIAVTGKGNYLVPACGLRRVRFMPTNELVTLQKMQKPQFKWALAPEKCADRELSNYYKGLMK